MTHWIADGTLAHLRDVAEWPDLGGRYEVTGRLGRGGMGAVFAAHDRTLDREVAVKVLDAADPAGDAAVRLLEEARILGRLEHPGIVPVHDAGTLPDGRVFYVMKLVRGARLSDALPSLAPTPRQARGRPEQRRGTSNVAGPAPPAHRLDLFLRVCEAVSFAHARGIVHRDLKPENIMLGPFGEVLVMDWGVAKVLAATESNVVVGTPGFMAPEQADGRRAVDGRADIYSLGAVLEAVMPEPLPRPLAAIARRARASMPADRYPTVEALAKDIMRFRDGEPVEAYRETVLEQVARVYRRHRVPIILVLVYMVVRVILLLWLRV